MHLLESMPCRIAIILLTFILLSFVYLSPSIRLTKYFEETYPPPSESVKLNSGEIELLKLEFAKNIDEIKFKLQVQDTWYNYKYLFIGAMLAILLGQAGLVKYLDETSPNQNIKSLKEIFSNGLIYLTVTFACVICVMIDMHIRRHMLDIQSLGMWNAYYGEPAFMGQIPSQSQFIPWESYLRLKATSGSESFFQNLANGAHTIALSATLHFLSTVAYLLYMVIFQQMCLDFQNWKNSMLNNKALSKENVAELLQSRKMIILFGFFMVHLTTFVFNLIVHSVHPRFEMQLFPFGQYTFSWASIGYYSIFWLALIGLSYLYLRLIWKTDTQAGAATTAILAAASTTANTQPSSTPTASKKHPKKPAKLTGTP